MAMKKLISIILTILLVWALVLGGCAKKSTEETAPEKPAEPNAAAAPAPAA
jgi:PBP1b-binding outer membrane lipoprotein LpoB